MLEEVEVVENVMNVATYFANRYLSEYGEKIDEMKLHKLMYFAQRESLIQVGEPLFDSVFYGWKYGPILKEIRSAFKNETFENVKPEKIAEDHLQILNSVFEDYAGKTSWSLSRLTHGEESWKNSRIGILDEVNSDNPMNIEDIKKDAERIKSRREMLHQLGLV